MSIEKVSKIWFGGRFVDWDKAQVHVLTHALHYGSGVFEGIRAYKNKKGIAVFRLQDHIDRLFESARYYQMKIPFSKKEITEAIKKIIKINKLGSCYIRPIVFRGYGEIGLYPKNIPVDVAIIAIPWGAYLGEDSIKNGVKAKISKWVRIPNRSLPMEAKATGQYLNSILAKMEIVDSGYDEAIMLDDKGYIAEGPGENIFIVKKDKIFTPRADSGILPGITRDSVIQIANELGFKVTEKNITPKGLIQANELFFTGTAAEVVPIKSVGRISFSKPWPITSKIQNVFYTIISGKARKYKQWLDYTS